MSSDREQHVGYVTIRIPVTAVTDSESWEIPEEYTYLSPGDAELVSHDIPSSWHDTLRDQIIESGIYLAAWTPALIASTCTRPVEAPTAAVPPLTLRFLPSADVAASDDQLANS